MGLLLFEDDDLDLLHEVINNLQICFHHVYAPDGHFSVKSLFELQNDDNNVRIIADRNIVSPICEIATKGKLKDSYRMQKIALFVTWAKYIRAQLSSGLGLYESDTSGLSTISGEENRLQFFTAWILFRHNCGKCLHSVRLMKFQLHIFLRKQKLMTSSMTSVIIYYIFAIRQRLLKSLNLYVRLEFRV